jgi:hypothetical protein
MDDFTLINFIVTDEYYGHPQPYISDATIVILIQEGKIILSRYIEATVDNPIPAFDHPRYGAANDEIENLLLEIIKEKYPQYLGSDTSVVLSCPRIITDKIVW